jgi:cell division septation protein DedD
VPDLTPAMHDGSDDGFHEIQLSGKQLVFLFMATTVVSVVIFLCGVLVGRGVRAERALGEDIPETPIAGAPSPAPTDTVADAGPPAAEPPTPPAEADASLSYKARLEGEKPAAETLRPPPPAPKAAAAPPPRPERAPTSGSRDSWVVQIVALRDKDTANSIVRRLSGKGYPAFLVNPAAGAPAPVFKVQVGRYNDRDEAEQVRRRLEKEEQFKPWISR